MLTFYRILTVFINAQLLILLAVLVYELIVKSYIDKVETGVISALLVYYIFTTSYFIWNTRKMKVYRGEYSVLDSDNLKITTLQPFRFDWAIGILNSLIGAFFVVFSLFIFVIAPPLHSLFAAEILRLLLLLGFIFYGALKIYYSVFALIQLKVIKKV